LPFWRHDRRRDRAGCAPDVVGAILARILLNHDGTMTVDPIYLVQLSLNGLILGLIYALIAVGLALIFGVLRIINFAHGEFLMVGAYAMAFALPAVGLAYWPAAAAAVVAAALTGLVIYQLFLSRLHPGEFERSILITLALSIILIHVVQYAFTANPRIVDTQYGFSGLMIGAIRITWTRVIAAAVALAAFGLLYGLLRHSQLGRAMRAIAQNREAALMVGIRPKRVARNAVMLATGLCGLAGAALVPIQLVTPIMGQSLIFKAFALVIIGGLGNIPGTIVASVALGLMESFVGGFFSLVWQDASVFIAMILVLLARPEGLFNQGTVRVG
jgi:branched-chain amino acid transport system permease protein